MVKVYENAGRLVTAIQYNGDNHEAVLTEIATHVGRTLKVVTRNRVTGRLKIHMKSNLLVVGISDWLVFAENKQVLRRGPSMFQANYREAPASSKGKDEVNE